MSEIVGIQLRQLYVLTCSRPLAMQKCHEQRDCAQHPRARVLIRRRIDRRIELTAELTRRAHVARHEWGEALALCLRTCRSPTGCIEINDVRVDCTYLVVPKAQTLSHADPEIVLDDVSPPQKLSAKIIECRVFEIGCY